MGAIPKFSTASVIPRPARRTALLPRTALRRFPSCRDPLNEPALFDALDPDEREELLIWVDLILRPGRAGRNRTAYGLKHDFQWNTGIYVYTGAFKGAMLYRGYQPVDPAIENWSFHIARVSDRARVEWFGADRHAVPWWLRGQQ